MVNLTDHRQVDIIFVIVLQLSVGGKRKVEGIRYEARSRGRSSPDTLAF